MASSKVMKSVSMMIFIFICVTLLAPKFGEATPISCNQVVSSLTPCVGYVVGGGMVPPNCCTGVKGVWNSATTTSDRQGLCTCLQRVVRGVALNSYNLALLAALPTQCGVNIPYRISPSTNCQSIK